MTTSIVQSPTGIYVSKPSPSGYVRALRQPLYDAMAVLKAGSAVLAFFQAPLGTVDNAAAIKTEMQTNMTQSGQLATPQMFDLVGFQVHVPEDSVLADVLILQAHGVFQFNFGTQRTWLQVPVKEIPGGSQILTYTAAAVNQNRGVQSVKEMYTFVKPKGQAYRIKATETFQARIFFPEGVVKPSANMYVWVYMLGTLYIPL